MELKDKLKQLRLEQKLTQAQLAEKLFVSRSTVAKWENGLGLPSPESMERIAECFGIPADDLSTTEPETVIVEKNKRIRWSVIGSITGWVAMLVLVVVMYILPFAIHNSSYGFTPEMAAGNYADERYIDTGDYRIFYFQFEGDWEDGRHWSSLQGWRPVRKRFWGCTVSEEDYSYRVITKDNYVVGRLYSIKGKHGYYNLISKAGIYNAPEQPGEPMIWDIPMELITATSVTIGSTSYELEDGFFFITQEEVEYFEIGDSWFDIE